MSYLERFMDAYTQTYLHVKPTFESNLVGTLKKANYLLLEEKYAPSSELKRALAKLQRRAEEPMKVAITGQFSSGKSTFLNALLAKNVLPTGITPVTSKVNYIRYGDELKIRVRYKDDREEYHSADSIQRFTDQRENVEDIAYLTLYSPLELLKDVVFVDTPGLNSQAKSDTETTEAVLKEVDGIIWLTLIDNAGKMSEAQVLERYMDAYQNKSLCVLNQKDKFTPEQVEQTTAYVKEAFASFFSEVVPISAIQALEARSHDRKVQLEESLDALFETLKQAFKTPLSMPDDATLSQTVLAYKEKAKGIMQSDLGSNLALLEESNINKVLDFIHQEIQPKAIETKDFAVRKDLKAVCTKLLEQHHSIIAIYDELEKVLEDFEVEAQKTFESLKKRFAKELQNAFVRIENIIEKIASEIFTHMETETRTRYALKKAGLLGGKKASYEAYAYQVSKIHADTIYKILFYDDDLIGKMFKQYVKNLRTIQDAVNEENGIIYQRLEHALRQWQKPYELIRKSEPLYSDVEFANVRKFASKAYENFLKPFNDEIRGSYAQVSSQFNHLSSAVSFNYQNATEVSVAFLERKIGESVKLYEENPTKFGLYQPKIDEIKERLRTSFHIYELENMMNTRNTFLNKNYDWLMNRFSKIKTERLAFLQEVKSRHETIIVEIETLKEEI